MLMSVQQVKTKTDSPHKNLFNVVVLIDLLRTESCNVDQR